MLTNEFQHIASLYNLLLKLSDTVEKAEAIDTLRQQLESEPSETDLKTIESEIQIELEKRKYSNINQAAREAAAIAVFIANRLLPLVAYDAQIGNLDNTKAKEFEEKFASIFQNLNDESYYKLLGEGKVISAAGKLASDVNQTAARIIQSPATSAAGAVGAAIMLGGGTVASMGTLPVALGITGAATSFAAQTYFGAKQINDMQVKIDELLHLEDYHSQKLSAEYNINALSHNTGINSQELKQIFGIQDFNPINIKSSNKNEAIKKKDLAKEIGKDWSLSITQTVAENLINSVAAFTNPAVAVIQGIKLGVSSLASVATKISEERAEKIINDKIEELRKTGPEYQTKEATIPWYQVLSNKILNNIRKTFNFETVELEAPAKSRKYDLAAKALEARVDALALEALCKDAEFQKRVIELKETNSYTHQQVIIKQLKQDLENKKKYFLDYELKNNKLYSQEQIYSPQTRLGKFLKSAKTSAQTVKRYSWEGNISFSKALDIVKKEEKKHEEERVKKEEMLAELEKRASAKKENIALIKRTLTDRLDGFIHKAAKIIGVTKDSRAQTSESSTNNSLANKPILLEKQNPLVKKIEEETKNGQLNKPEIINFIKNQNQQDLKIPVEINGTECSILEYLVNKNAGHKVISALTDKVKFSSEEMENAVEKLKTSSTKKSRINNTEKILRKAMADVENNDKFLCTTSSISSYPSSNYCSTNPNYRKPHNSRV